MKTKTIEDFKTLSFEEAIKKYPDIKTWATGFLLTCHSQASVRCIYSDIRYLKLQEEVDRRFKKFQGENK